MSHAAAAPPGASALTIPSAVAAEVRERVRDAAGARQALRIVGGGSWLDAGRPVRADATRLSLAEHDGVVEYEPGDLTLTAKAGTPLRSIRQATGSERQWLTLDPYHDDSATIGATIATASYGPLAHAFGTPRDHVLGVEFVTGTGDVVRGGGRVVKNVAGFDLARLVTGAWGTLGVITEVTVRLRALPDVVETVVLDAPGTPSALAALLARLRAAAIAPLALELVNDRLARAAEISDGAAIVVHLGGNEPSVRAQSSALRAVGDPRTERIPGAALQAAASVTEHALPAPLAVQARLSTRPSRLPALWAEALRLAEALGGAYLQASVGRGVVRITAAADAATLRAAFAPPSAEHRAPTTVIFERLPATLWPELAPSAATDRLSRGVRAAFDPCHILNPGILGEIDAS